jgi:uncharacterized protein (TIGR02246 family)
MSGSEAEREIRQMFKDWSEALERKDVGAMMANYEPDSVLFDAIPPYKTVGMENIRNAWEQCLPYFPEKFESVHEDLTIHVDGDVAFAHGMHRFNPTPPDHPSGTTWMRITIGYRRKEGKWKVVHEHVSIPFNPMDNSAWMIKSLDDFSVPDYCGTGSC